MKPILFNTEMVRAILDGRKTVTRRLVKPQPGFFYDVGGRIPDPDNPERIAFLAMDPDDHEEIRVPPFQPGDVLYVRETWGYNRDSWLYKADYREDEWPLFIWHPSIHMPKKTARIFLRVKDVRVERLQDITVDQVAAEGIDALKPSNDAEELCNYCLLPDESKGIHCYGGSVHMCEGSHCGEAMDSWEEEYICEFAGLWNSTIKPADIPVYGWDANPWVWVIEFEKISREEAMKC